MEPENQMDNETPNAGYDPLFVRNMIEAALRIGFLLVAVTGLRYYQALHHPHHCGARL